MMLAELRGLDIDACNVDKRALRQLYGGDNDEVSEEAGSN